MQIRNDDHVVQRQLAQKKFWDEEWSKGRQGHSTWIRDYYTSATFQGHTVLDVACGPSSSLASLARDSARLYVGVDLSGKALELHRSDGHTQDTLVKANSISLPFADNSFEIVAMISTLTLLGRDAFASLREMARVSSDIVLFNAILTEPQQYWCPGSALGNDGPGTIVEKIKNQPGIVFSPEEIELMMNLFKLQIRDIELMKSGAIKIVAEK